MTDRDWFTDAFGSAVADIRAKLLDEAWFGRRTHTANRGSITETVERASVEPTHNPWELDRGIDR